ncbi:MAG: CCA tRNA nucleotidyltransferase [Phycisphaerae bacterium]
MSNRKAAIEIVKQLRKAGFEALLAGGCVRDMLLGRNAKDYDVATNAMPQQVINLFRRTIKIGSKFGVVIVMTGREQVEVATFRSDINYEDGRHPSGVKFVTAKKDAERRDFTINGMFYDPIADKVIDYVQGKADLKKKLIRTIGSPQRRFAEDYLRMLRAIRFSAQLSFSIEPATWRAICRQAHNITKISGERIAMELEGILTCPNRSNGAKMLIESGLAQAVFPDFSDNCTNSVEVLENLNKNIGFCLALAAFFSDWPSDYAMKKCDILKLSCAQSHHLKSLLNNRGVLLSTEMPLSQLRKLAAEPFFDDLCELEKAIQKVRVGGRKAIAPIIKIKQRIKALGNIELTPKPLLNGHELISFGAVEGPALGHLAGEMYTAQLNGHLKTAKQARNWVMKWLKEHRKAEK